MIDQIKHECGIALIRLLKPLAYYAKKYKTPLYGINKLYILMEKQHNRGQDGAGVGIVNFDLPPGKQYIYRNRSVQPSPIADIFTQMQNAYKEFQSSYPVLDIQVYKENLPFLGELLMGHLRYATHGDNDMRNVHPVFRANNYKTRNLLLAGNFNMTNNHSLFKMLLELGQFPVSITDTITVLEKIGHFLDSENEFLYQKFREQGHTKKNITDLIAENISLEYILRKSAVDFDGGYAISGIIGHGDAFILRDPNGIRPAYFYVDDEHVIVASEKPAIRTTFNLPYQKIEEVLPGHALIIKKNGKVDQIKILEPKEKKSCSFERIYFSRGTDEDIYKERKNLGRFLAPRILKRIDYDLEHTVFSFIPNTAELAFKGLTEGLNDYLNEKKAEQIMAIKENDPEKLKEILDQSVRVERIAVKDTKIRTFITQDSSRHDLVSHVYDSTYGLVATHVDTLVVLDDSIVRGTTLKESVISLLNRLAPKRLMIVSSAPQIRYPDCYGIDMSKLQEFIAFRAAIALLKENNKDYIIRDVYRKCKEEQEKDSDKPVNHVREIYKEFSVEQLTLKIAEMLKPDDMEAELIILYQSIEDLHKSLPHNQGDWYFTGNYPTEGGTRVVNQAYINFYEGRSERSYL